LIVLICSGAVLAAEPGLDNFENVKTYENGQFTDVKSTDWFSANVATAYEMGLMNGTSATYFNAQGNITIAEAVALACRLHSIYYDDGAVFSQGRPWYQVYVSYAIENGIISTNYDDFSKKATRAEFASILAGALPDEALTAINTIEDGAIPDVNTSFTYSSAVYKLYRAGILTGNDYAGTFTPSSYISRSAVSAIVTRMADPGLRQYITLYKQTTVRTALTSAQIYTKCSSAVFRIVTYDKADNEMNYGSGFFINANGDAVVSCIEINGASDAYIFLQNEEYGYPVESVLGYDYGENIAIIHVDIENSDYIEIGDSSTVVGGQKVYSLSYPLDLDCTITTGLISNPNRMFGDISQIQTTAQYSEGSDGGALLNEYGEVIGVSNISFSEGQNINFATPVNLINSVYGDKPLSLEEVYYQVYPPLDDVYTYNVCDAAPDFGAFFGEKAIWTNTYDDDPDVIYYYYSYDYRTVLEDYCRKNHIDDINDVDAQGMYEQLLVDCGYFYASSFDGEWLNHNVTFNVYGRGNVGIYVGHCHDELVVCVMVPRNQIS